MRSFVIAAALAVAGSTAFAADLFVVGTAKNVSGVASYIRAGVTYLYASRSEGFSMNVGYWF